MSTIRQLPINGILGAVSTVVLLGAGYFGSYLGMALGLAGAGLVAFRLKLRERIRPSESGPKAKGTNSPTEPDQPAPRPPVRKIQIGGSGSLVEEMLSQGRFPLLVRPQIIDNLQDRQLRETVAALQQSMALVPSGQVVLGEIDDALDDGRLSQAELEEHQGRVVEVQPVFLDRYPVTNEQFQQFVDAGGYEEMAIWDEEILPALLDFVDSTGNPGPWHWEQGACLPGMERHPVTGVSWYEAVAYGRWCGKRMPTDAEWTKAASWPVALGPGIWQQRKYPWGNSFEGHRANVWISGNGCTVPIDEFGEGVSVGGINQLIGNVWEWTSGSYGSASEDGITLPVPMKSIRGGAFDTYFENQATCQFQSGESPIGRKYNIGFRLALGACDLAPKAARLVLDDNLQTESAAVGEEVMV